MPFPVIIAAAAAAVGSWVTSTAFASFAVKTAISIGLSAAAQALAGKKKTNSRPRVGVQTSVSVGADVPRSFIVGRAVTAGSLVYHNQWGKAQKVPNAYYTAVFAVSDLPVKGLAGVWIDGARVTLDLDNPDADGKGFPVVEYTDNINKEVLTTQEVTGPDGNITVARFVSTANQKPFAWVKFYDGRQTTADAYLQSDVSTAERPWTSNAIGDGVAYAIVTARFHPSGSKYWRGLPVFKFEVEGIDVDTPGGGSIAGDENPIRQTYHILKGIRYRGAWFYGPQNPAAQRLDDAQIATEAGKCDDPVPGADTMSDAEKIAAFGSTTVPAKYRASAEIPVNVEPVDALSDLLAACNGRATDTGRAYRVQVGDPQLATWAITDSDIRVSSPQTFQTIKATSETFNGAVASYPEPEEGWQSQSVTYGGPVFEAEDDNQKLPANIDLPAVPYREQVQRVIRAAVKEHRRARRHAVTLPASFRSIGVGEFLAWDSARNGYTDKKFRIDAKTFLPDGGVGISITEIAPNDYDWSADTDYENPDRGSVTPDIPIVAAVDGWGVQAITIPDANNGGYAPALRLFWDDEIEDARALSWQLRIKATGDGAVSGTATNVEAGGLIVTSGIVFATTYEVRAKVEPASTRETAWTSWTEVTTEATNPFEKQIEQLFLDQDLHAIKDVPTLAGIQPGTRTGQKIFVRDEGKLYEWDGAAWVLVYAGTVVDDLLGQITETQISNNAITTPKLAALSITGGKIQGSTITGGKIAANTITGGLMAASGIITNSAQINNALINTAHVEDLAVERLKIGPNAVSATSHEYFGERNTHFVNVAGNNMWTTTVTPGADCSILIVLNWKFDSADPGDGTAWAEFELEYRPSTSANWSTATFPRHIIKSSDDFNANWFNVSIGVDVTGTNTAEFRIVTTGEQRDFSDVYPVTVKNARRYVDRWYK